MWGKKKNTPSESPTALAVQIWGLEQLRKVLCVFLELFPWGSWSRNLSQGSSIVPPSPGCRDPQGAAFLGGGDTWSLRGWGLFGPPPKVQPGGKPPAFGKA